MVQHPKEAFRILGLDEDCPPEEIRRAYRELARRYHPDLSDAPDAAVRFKEIQLAYVRLDESGACGIEVPTAVRGGVEHVAELDFTALNGSSSATAGSSMLDAEIEVQVSLEEAWVGSDVHVRAQMPERDPVLKQVRTVERSVRVRLPGNLVNGERLTVPGFAALGAGDLHLTVRFKKHSLFHVVGSDVFMKYPIAPWEAVLGAILDVPTLQGPVQVPLKPGIGGGQKLRLQGRGLPKEGGGTGDLYCVLRIVTPRGERSERERALYRELAEISKFQPREQLRV